MQIKTSVIIPTKNPGNIFRDVLSSVLTQQTLWPFEVIVIDSGSNDGTLEYANSHTCVRVISIPPSEFGHGKTRNYAISKAQGEFIALLTHDALPANDAWLQNLVDAVAQDPNVAGAFGRHIAYQAATEFTRRDIQGHFEGFLAHPLVVNKDTDPLRFENDTGWRQFLHYYSDNNSCLRRSVWESIPYPNVEFAEDQIWASKIIEAGWSKAYAYDAAVYHSHDYSPFEKLQRSFDEGMAFRKLFGYRLGGRPRYMLKAIFGLGASDWQWGKEHNVQLKPILARLMENTGLVVGHVLGSRYEKVPYWLQNKLSRDKRLFNSFSTGNKGNSMKGFFSWKKNNSLNSSDYASPAQVVDTSIAQAMTKIDVVGFWSFVQAEFFGAELSDTNKPPKNTINWFVPPFAAGSGGHLNIFRFVFHLEKMGFKCRVIICNDSSDKSPEALKQNITDWFFPLKADVFVYPQQNIPTAEFSIATGWQTAYTVRAFRSTEHRCYFVQDFEPYFYAPGTEYALAEETYRFGFTGITAGTWLATKLKNEYGMMTESFGFSYDHNLYSQLPRRDATQRIFFYGRPPTPRRGFDLGILILAELAKRLPDVEVVIAGWDVSGYNLPFRNLPCGILTLAELPDLYSHCDAALVLSFTNASLLPLELMACGCVVVSNTGPNVEWLLNERNSVLAHPTIDDMVNALQRIMEDNDYRQKIVENAMKTAALTSWEKEAEKVANILHTLQAKQ